MALSRRRRYGLGGPTRRGRAAVGKVAGLWSRTALAFLIGVACVASGCSSRVDDARALEDVGDWGGALAVYEQILDEDADDLLALSGAAVALMVMQRWDEALPYQEMVIAADPEEVQIRVELGFNYLNYQERPTDAVRVLSEAASLDPSAKHLCFLAQSQEEAGDAEAAEEALRKAIDTDGSYVYAYKLLVGLLESQGRDGEAMELMEEAQSLGLDIGDLGWVTLAREGRES